MNLKVKSFYHKPTFTWTHLLICKNTKYAVVIDPVLDFDSSSASTSTEFIDEILEYINLNSLYLKYVLETHAHADHLSSAQYLKNRFSSQVVIGQHISSVQTSFKNIFNLGSDFKDDGSQFDALLSHNDVLTFGDLEVVAMHTPGHTEDSMSYIVEDCVFIGDTLFSPDYGSARCDFPGGNAEKLYDSVQSIYNLGANKKLYLCHDYPPKTREAQAAFLSKDQQQNNKHLSVNVSKKDFVKYRNLRDKGLSQPKLIIPAIQVNIEAGKFPKPENNGNVYLKTPLNVL